LKRLGLADKATSILPLDLFPPACGQGAIAITARTDDSRVQADLAEICDVETAHALAAERAFLNVLDGSCRTPIAGHAVVVGGRLGFYGIVLRKDGSEIFDARVEGPVKDAAILGETAARKILASAPADLLSF
jgi:hydroxymethylbilane synthase